VLLWMGTSAKKPALTWGEWMAKAAKEWRVRADRIESMFSGKKDKPPSYRLWGVRSFFLLLLLVGAVAGTTLYATGSLNPQTGKVGSWIAGRLRGGARYDHSRPVSKLAKLLGKPDGDALVDELNSRFSALPIKDQPAALLKWAAEEIPQGRWCQVTSFGPSGLVALDVMSKAKILHNVQIATVDTLHLFPETYELTRAVKKHFGLDALRVYRPEGAATREEFEQQYGEHLWRADPHLFDFLTKVDPMRKALEDMETLVWVTGRRRSQGADRATLRLVEVDPSDGRVKINPLANWGKEEVWGYIKQHKVPYNALHDQGYGSIGDVVTTEKTAPGAKSEREGRFKGQNRTECGMHVAVSGDSVEQMHKRSDIVRKGYAWEYAERERCHEAGIKQVTQDNFEKVVIQSKENILLEVYAPWCGHCQQYAPVFREVAEKLRDLPSPPPGGGGSWADGRVPEQSTSRSRSSLPSQGFPNNFPGDEQGEGHPCSVQR